jgi:hypothetical protein
MPVFTPTTDMTKSHLELTVPPTYPHILEIPPVLPPPVYPKPTYTHTQTHTQTLT